MPCNEWWERPDGGHGRVAAHDLPYQAVIDILRERERHEAEQLRKLRELEERFDEHGFDNIWSPEDAEALWQAHASLGPLTAAVEQARREAYRRASQQESLKLYERYLDGRLEEYLEYLRAEAETLRWIGFSQ